MAVSTVKDEADVIAATVTHMCEQVDMVIVADNGSTDNTRPILESLIDAGLPLVVLDDPEVGYMQSVKMTRLAHLAGSEYDATWIVPFDADEIWLGSNDRLADTLAACSPQTYICSAALFDHVVTGLDDLSVDDPTARIQWRRSVPAPLNKVACRYQPDLVIGMGNHEAWYDDDTNHRVVPPAAHDRLTVRHFPYRSAAQVIRKVRNGSRAYAATDLPATYGAHWRQWGVMLDEHGEDAIVELFNVWYRHEDPTTVKVVDGEQLPALVHDPAAVCR